VEFGRRNDACTGLLCYSERSGPGVVLLHEFFGLQDSFKEYSARLCDQGFTVLAPDLYDGRIAGSVDEALEIEENLDREAGMRRVEAACDFLVDNWHPRVGTIGFSMGTEFADGLARSRPVEATVLYYGLGKGDAKGFSGSLLVHLAESDEWMDEWMTDDEIKGTISGLVEGGVDAEVHTYPGTTHWFANLAVPDAYVDEAAELAFTRTVDFLKHNLA
jgi:carboxymethylenebutenolidase